MQYKKIEVKKTEKKTNKTTKDSFLNELLSVKNIENIESFLSPSRQDFISPFAFCDMQKAKERIFEAIEKKQI